MLFKIFQVFEKLQHVRTMFPTLKNKTKLVHLVDYER